MPKFNYYLIFALIFALLNMGIIFGIFGVQTYRDSQDYFQVVNWLQGEPGGQALAWRLLRPLALFIALPFEFLGEGAGLIVQNIIFYLLSAFLIFKIVEIIYRDRKQALLASIFFVTAISILDSGLAYLVDMGGWFFYLLSIFLTLAYVKIKQGKLIILNGFLSGIGLLMKETGGLGALFFGLMILLSRDFNIKEKILKIISFGFFLLIPFAVVQILVFKYFHFTYWDWYFMNRPGVEGENTVLIYFRYLGQLFKTLGILWPFVLLGLWQELREKNRERIKIFLALLPASFSFLFWTGGGSGRAAFIFAPLGILLASYGCKKIRPWILVLIITVATVLNYWFVSVNQEIPFVDIIYNMLMSNK